MSARQDKGEVRVMVDLAEVTKKSKAWACYDCGKCTATCPIARVGGSYSPRRHILDSNTGNPAEVMDRDTLFACLSCSLCEQRCPAQVVYTDLVLHLRELAFSEGIEPDCPHGGTIQSLMRLMASGGTVQNRMEWIEDDLKTTPTEGDVFYWTGCAMYYDALFPDYGSRPIEGTKAAIRLFNKLGVTPVVSPEERCCGHDLLWNGDRKSFEQLARHNLEVVKKSGASLLVTSCAECLRTWAKEYQTFGAGKLPKIMHMTEYIAEHLPELDLKENGVLKVTYQDPCRLGRQLGIYDPPREVMEALPGVELVEMRHSKQGAQCCAGGTWSNCDIFAKQIQVDRLREARATGAEVMATACPKCQIHFSCAMKDPLLKEEIKIEMRDVAELVLDLIS